MTNVVQILPESALAELRVAFEALDYPSFAARLSSVVGMPIEAGLRLMNPSVERAIRRAATAAITHALQWVITTMPGRPPSAPTNRWHAAACIGAGAVGGFFGPLGLLLELPVTTGIILRSIADIARAQGESLTESATQFACIEVFALGGPSTEDDAAETGYYGMRLAMAAHFSTFSLMLDQATSRAALPGTVVAIRAVAQRFGIVVTDKMAAELVPILGAAAGAIVNGLFVRHFQTIATGHFIVRRLERDYGAHAVRTAYERLRVGDAEKSLRSAGCSTVRQGL